MELFYFLKINFVLKMPLVYRKIEQQNEKLRQRKICKLNPHR